LINPDEHSATLLGNVSCSVLACNGPRKDNKVRVTSGSDDGSFTVQFQLKDSAAPFGLAPDLDGSITFTPDGKGGYTTHGSTDSYPSSDIYQRVDGQWKSIAPSHDETSPWGLFDISGRYKW